MHRHPYSCKPYRSQFFEGVALGSRLVDAAFASITLEVGLVAVFAVSAPIGMAVGTALVFSGEINPSSPMFLIVQVGLMTSVCFLIYLTC